MISSSTLIGIFVGAFAFGWLTDRFGRRPLFVADLILFSGAAILLFFVQEPWQMFALGIALRLAVGADYAIGTPLLSEFSPRSARGRLGSTLQIAWNVGYMVAFLIGFLITSSHPDAWRWVLLSAAIPAILCLIARHGLPGSPRWLLSKGRVEEAAAVLDRLGWSLESGDFHAEAGERTRISALFAPGQLGRTVFVCVFWLCLVIPYFAIIFFQTAVYEALGLSNAILTALLGTIVVVLGATLGTFLVDRIGRRRLLIVPSWIMAVALLIVIFEQTLPAPVIVVCFFAYLFSYGVASVLCGVYPMELFPTAVRTTGVGFASSVSRIGSAIGTFVFPLVLDWNVPVAMAVMAAVCVTGAIVSQMFAPETRGRSLTDVASADIGRG
ncbi:sugar transporter [Leifsonia xyli subsp. cynodontis DSM 46306]|uniref:Major facilitator superfamily (MFS) profile domain-containing protein n=1 Tax=Leifsonia xyli subsp. cynodontis DSM 46306 TaxID=1389489 RepID=U3P992_LEIXC|nr:MFS transporter [Leifsonia xyli]AGW42094.1 sugar transporter [Leifsonia xyli subsp. cynodontis DSM 46306]